MCFPRIGIVASLFQPRATSPSERVTRLLWLNLVNRPSICSDNAESAPAEIAGGKARLDGIQRLAPIREKNAYWSLELKRDSGTGRLLPLIVERRVLRLGSRPQLGDPREMQNYQNHK